MFTISQFIQAWRDLRTDSQDIAIIKQSLTISFELNRYQQSQTDAKLELRADALYR